MLDGSYSGFTQYLLTHTSTSLKALFVREGGADHYRDFLYHNGAFQLSLNLGWALGEMLAVLKHETAPQIQRHNELVWSMP